MDGDKAPDCQKKERAHCADAQEHADEKRGDGLLGGREGTHAEEDDQKRGR
jgi:hypothetical protein